jgi:Flp pilus assembly protein TadG
VVEAAVVYPVVFMLLLGLVIGGLGIFRYQEVAHLAREGARWAAVHGGQYAKETGKSAATQDDVNTKVVQSEAIILDPARLNCTVSWDDSSEMPVYYDTKANKWKTNNVTVTVTYQWMPEVYLVGPLTLTTTTTTPVCY